MGNLKDSKLFSCGNELADFVTSCEPLLKSWSVISPSYQGIVHHGEGISWKVYKQVGYDLIIIAFEATPSANSSNLQPDLISSDELREKNFLDFELMCTESNPVLCLNSTAVSLFIKNHDKFDLETLKSEINSSPLIVTGHGLGGAVASLFTMSLLDSIGSAKNHPLCITFGSPLVGDKNLQQAISRSSIWNSCFLHVVSHKDPLPRLFITNTTSSYTPFGTFLLCSDKSSTCFESPTSVLEILKAFGAIHIHSQGFQSTEYGNIVENLNLKAICKDFSTPVEDKTHSDLLETGISLQLQALGYTDSPTSGISMQLGALALTPQLQQQQHNIDVKDLKTKEKRFIMLRSKGSFDPSKKLNKVKGHMAQLEWYKKKTKDLQIGYYNSYKNMNSESEYFVVELYKKLTKYWEKTVEEAEMKPQKEGAAFQHRWLYGGTNYRRMVEPLAIAQYYKDGGKDYINEKRSKHFKKLEQWLKEGNTKAQSALNITSRKNVEAILTIDSCFWAHVEEALLLCKNLKEVKEKEEVLILKKLVEFEEYVYELLKKYAVSPEIFLVQSSYMKWWNEYKAIRGSSYTSKLANFMNDDSKVQQYASGAYDFP